MPAPLLVSFAVPEEAAAFRRSLVSLAGVELLVTGMGRRNAERAFGARIRMERPEAVVTCGFAGGLNPDLRPGALLYDADDGFPFGRALQEAGARRAVFVCAERIATTPAEKRMLRERSGADAVEMESGWIRALCEEEHVPAATLRVITDAADEALPLDFNLLLDEDNRLRWGRLASTVLRHPSAVAGLRRLHRRSREGSEILGRALVRAISAARRGQLEERREAGET